MQNYLEKGYIKRINRDLYGFVSPETEECAVDKFLIASNITDTSFVSHHSALEFYGYCNQVYRYVNVSSLSKFNDFDFEGNHFSLIKVATDNFVDSILGVRVASIERTIVDCIKDSEKYCELEETLASIDMLPYVSSKVLLSYMEELGSKILYKKIGVIMSLFKEKFNIPHSFFEKCHEVSDSVKGYFGKNKEALTYSSEWKMFIPKDLGCLIRKE